MTLLIDARTLTPDYFAPDDYAVFGGTFDPMHRGHVTIIRSLAQLIPHTMVAPAASNPWKPEPPAPSADRLAMIRLVLGAERLLDGPPGKVEIRDLCYVFAEDAVRTLRAERGGRLFWAVGEDSAPDVHRWRNWDALDVPVLVFPISLDTHATAVRSGHETPHDAVAEYIRERKLYERTP